MVDLITQYEKIKPAIDEAILSVIQNAQFINGPEVQNFQKELEEYLEVKHVIPCANGTDALQIALMSLDLVPGDEVITPSFTYIATTVVIALLGLKPIFVDVDPATFCIDATKIEAAITPKTKAVIGVHLYGQPFDIDAVKTICDKHNLFLVEDAAQAQGARYKGKTVGVFGEMACFSFYPGKNLGALGDAGAIVTNDLKLSELLKQHRNYGSQIKYEHIVQGFNCRLDELQAAFLRIKLSFLDQENNHRKKIAKIYNPKNLVIAFSGIEPSTLMKQTS